MRQFEQDWLELGSRVARSLHYQHGRNLRLVEATVRVHLHMSFRVRLHMSFQQGRSLAVVMRAPSFGR
jgi:hypothetical protein